MKGVAVCGHRDAKVPFVFFLMFAIRYGVTVFSNDSDVGNLLCLPLVWGNKLQCAPRWRVPRRVCVIQLGDLQWPGPRVSCQVVIFQVHGLQSRVFAEWSLL